MADHERRDEYFEWLKRNNLKVNLQTPHMYWMQIAYGPGAELFSGIYENTELYQKMSKILLNESIFCYCAR